MTLDSKSSLIRALCSALCHLKKWRCSFPLGDSSAWYWNGNFFPTEWGTAARSVTGHYDREASDRVI